MSEREAGWYWVRPHNSLNRVPDPWGPMEWRAGDDRSWWSEHQGGDILTDEDMAAIHEERIRTPGEPRLMPEVLRGQATMMPKRGVVPGTAQGWP